MLMTKEGFRASGSQAVVMFLGRQQQGLRPRPRISRPRVHHRTWDLLLASEDIGWLEGGCGHRHRVEPGAVAKQGLRGQPAGRCWNPSFATYVPSATLSLGSPSVQGEEDGKPRCYL